MSASAWNIRSKPEYLGTYLGISRIQDAVKLLIPRRRSSSAYHRRSDRHHRPAPDDEAADTRQPGPGRSELVTVTFDACDTGTEVTVEHVQIPDERLKTNHAAGWAACIDRLAAYA